MGVTTGGTAAQAVLAVRGMHCGACSELIRETLDEEPAVAEVTVTRDPDEVHVTYDATKIGVAELTAVIEALGYEALLKA